jgi:predicted PhzF superfamily epimerase YddE/YHI9
MCIIKHVSRSVFNHICSGVIVTCQGAPDNLYDFYSRFFAPRYGIPEDPVTGSAHCALAPYWSHFFPGKCTFMARQASPRGGDIIVRLEKKTHRVYLRGGAVFTMRGKLL